MMINTITIHYQYDETDGTLPSGLPKGPAYCSLNCQFLDSGNCRCNLFMSKTPPVQIGEPKRLAFVPAFACRNHEMQGR